MSNICDLCGLEEPRRSNRLVAACDCYKKHEDKGRVHQECLKGYLEQLAFTSGQAAPRCPVCKKAYNFRLRRRFVCDCRHLCSFDALHNSFELFSLILVTAGVVFTFSILDFRELQAEAGTYGMGVLGVMSLVCAAAAVTTVVSVFRRWRASTSDAELIDSMSLV